MTCDLLLWHHLSTTQQATCKQREGEIYNSLLAVLPTGGSECDWYHLSFFNTFFTCNSHIVHYSCDSLTCHHLSTPQLATCKWREGEICNAFGSSTTNGRRWGVCLIPFVFFDTLFTCNSHIVHYSCDFLTCHHSSTTQLATCKWREGEICIAFGSSTTNGMRWGVWLIPFVFFRYIIPM